MYYEYSQDFFKREPSLVRGISCYLENFKGEILLQLRDEYAPREAEKWCPPSGGLEKYENPTEALVREMKEEIGIKIENYKYFRDYLWISKEPSGIWYNHNFVFLVKMNLSTKDIILREGREIKFFHPKEIYKLNLAFNHNRSFRDIMNNSRICIK